jgi:hypothetical protein
MTARGQFDLVGHSLIKYEEIALGSPAKPNNWIIAPENPDDEWARTLMRKIGEWRPTLRSTYIRWAMSINGLHVAAAKYRESKDQKKFVVSSIRSNSDGSARQEVIADYTFKEAAEYHLQIQPMLCAHGFIDMYAGLEEMTFTMYRAYWKAKPDQLLKGQEFAQLRKMRSAAAEAEEAKSAWEAAFEQRINDWQRKKLYDGLDKVVLGLCQNAGLATPVAYTVTTIKTWAESIAGVSLIRNLLMHGESTVPSELETSSKKPWGLGFHFEAGAPLRLELFELQVLENFTEHLLTGMNLSLIERACPSFKTSIASRGKGND